MQHHSWGRGRGQTGHHRQSRKTRLVASTENICDAQTLSPPVCARLHGKRMLLVDVRHVLLHVIIAIQNGSLAKVWVVRLWPQLPPLVSHQQGVAPHIGVCWWTRAPSHSRRWVHFSSARSALGLRKRC
jgi:hypothetical protein